MNTTFIEYPKCTTCKKAKKWLSEQGVEFADRHIVDENPSAEELRSWWQASGVPLKKFFNTCGVKYREMNLSEQLKTMSEDEQLTLLASDGLLVKRPILVTAEGKVVPGFKAETWSAALGK